MKTIVIHHSADYDGIFCREIARKFLPDAELVGWDFGDPPVKPTADFDQVFILDLPCDKPLGLETHRLWPGVSNLVWIDHHKSAIESHPAEIPGYRIDGVAACRLAWQWFKHYVRDSTLADKANPFWSRPDRRCFVDRVVSEPLAVRLAGEYDIWDKRDPRAELFQYGLRSCGEILPEAWERILEIGPNGDDSVANILAAGASAQRYAQHVDASTMHRSFILDFEGLTFLALNTARCNSLSFAAKDVPETGHDALMGFYWNGVKWTVSLYHARHRTELDLSTIAVKFGGGGHRGACGFQADKLPFIP